MIGRRTEVGAQQPSDGADVRGAATGATSAAKPMSEDHMAKMKACNGISSDEMATHADGMDIMRVHPDMMRQPETVKCGG